MHSIKVTNATIENHKEEMTANKDELQHCTLHGPANEPITRGYKQMLKVLIWDVTVVSVMRINVIIAAM